MTKLHQKFLMLSILSISGTTYASLTTCNSDLTNQLNQRYNSPITKSDFTSNNPI
jgi:hypothetical protein